MEFDAELGWRPRANLDTHYLINSDDVYRIQTDVEGWPRVDPLGKDHDVVVIGDSFAFGFGVDTGSSFADLPETPKIKAVGANAYSMVHGVILMRQLAHRLSGKLVVWFVCVENDLYDNLFPSVFGYRAPFVRKKMGAEDWEIVSGHISADPWISSARIRPDILAELCTPTPLSDRIYSACRYLIGEASEICRIAGAQLVVFPIPNLNQLEPEGRKKLASKSSRPDQFDAYYPEKNISRICRDYEVPFVAGSTHLASEDYKLWERWHWNDRGHAKVAEMLRSLYDSHVSGRLTADFAPPTKKTVSSNALSASTV